MQSRIFGFVDDAHAAAADLFPDQVMRNYLPYLKACCDDLRGSRRVCEVRTCSAHRWAFEEAPGVLTSIYQRLDFFL
jgi:hypothetical protein